MLVPFRTTIPPISPPHPPSLYHPILQFSNLTLDHRLLGYMARLVPVGTALQLGATLNNQVQPSSEPVPGLRNLELDDRDGRVVVSTVELLTGDGGLALGYNGRADEAVCVGCPNHGAADAILDVHALKPRTAGVGVPARSDLFDEGGRPVFSVIHAIAANQLFRHVGVPDVVQIRLGAVEGDVDGVASHGQVLHVQRLVDIAQEVNDPFEGLLAFCDREVFIGHTSGVIGNGGHNTAFLGAVALVVHVAGRRRRVEGIDIMERRGESTLSGVAVRISPCCNVAQVGRRGVVEK